MFYYVSSLLLLPLTLVTGLLCDYGLPLASAANAVPVLVSNYSVFLWHVEDWKLSLVFCSSMCIWLRTGPWIADLQAYDGTPLVFASEDSGLFVSAFWRFSRRVY